MSDSDQPLGPAEADAEAVASAESVLAIYSALAPEQLEAEVAPPDVDPIDDPLLARQAVHVVLVAHDGARWLPRTLQALRRVDGPIASVTAVDTGSRDETAALLSRSPVVSTLVSAPAATGYPAAVGSAMAQVAASAANDATSQPDEHEWIWLIHDDSAPQSECLRWLLHAAFVHDAAVVGPKVLDWEGRRLLVELGLTITGSGRRHTGLEGREFDQGQHDDRRDVLAVGTAGMLVRRDVWDSLDGLDPQIDLFRDDVDFGWRARLAGHRVVVEPRALLEHAAAATAGRRRLGAATHPGPLTDRRNAVHVVLANVRRAAFLPVLVRVVLGSLLRAIGFVVGKVPGVAYDELVAVSGALNPGRLRSARRWRRAQPRGGSIRGLRPTLGTQARHALDNASAVVSGRSGGQDVPSSRQRSRAQQPLVGDEHEEMPVGDGWLARVSSRPGVWLVGVTALLTLLSARTVLLGGRLSGGALLPAPDSGGDWWSTYLADWHPVGLGSGEAAPPLVAALAAMSVPLFGYSSGLVTVLVLGAVPLATASAWGALRGLGVAPPMRLWAAATYGVLLLSTGAVAAGRLGTAVTAVLAPFLVRAAGMALRPGAPVRHAWRTAGLLALSAAFTPVIWPVAAVATLVLVITAYRTVDGLLRWLIIWVVPAALLIPWLTTLAARPGALVAEAGLTGRGSALSDPALPAFSPLLLAPGGPGSVPTGLLVLTPLVALLALVMSRSAAVRLAWVLAVLAMMAAVVTSRVAVSSPLGEGTAAGWPGPMVVLAGLALLLAAVLGIDVTGLWARSRPAAAVVVVAALASTAVPGAIGLVTSTTDPLTRVDATLLPVYVAEESAGPDQVRTLVLRPARGDRSGAIEFSLVGARTPVLGDAALVDPAGDALLAPVVADVVAGRGAASAGRLAAFGVRYVFVASGADTGLVDALDGQPGLTRASAPDGGAIWRVEGITARVRLLGEGESSEQPVGVPVASTATEVTATLATGSAEQVVLADLDDPGWSATLDGEPLAKQTHAGGLLAFDLAQSSGELRIVHHDPARAWLLVAQAIALVAVLVAMVPSLGGRRESLDGSLL